jgi:hypothetical protein
MLIRDSASGLVSDKRGVAAHLILEELERSLPNGFHDAELTSLHVDYAKREAIVGLNIDFSTPEATGGSEEESYRPGRVVFSGLHFIAIDPPAPGYEYLGVSLIDSGMGQPRTNPREVPPLDEGVSLCWLFVVRWNGFVRIAAHNVTLQWADEAPADR